MTVATPSRRSWQGCPPRFGTPRRPERLSRGPEVGHFAQAIGTPLMPWQQHVADVALEIEPTTGRYAYREIVLTVPRRSGKSTLLLAVLLHRMLGMGRTQVAAFTMQNGLTARMRMKREWHTEVLQQSTALRNTYTPSWVNGAEALMFHNGSRLEASAGTSSSGHGATLDLAVVDEAFDQPDDRLEQAFRPAIRTQPDAQLWWVSTAGSPTDLWFRGKVEAARLGAHLDRGTAVFEWSAADDADPSSRDVWWDCMPALGFVRDDGSGLTEQDIADDFEAMRHNSLDGFRRAYLNQWVNRGSDGAFDLTKWLLLAATDPQRPTNPVFGVALSLDQGHAAIVAAGEVEGHPQISVLDHRPGTSWVVPRLVKLALDTGAPVVLDKGGPAGTLLRDLKDARLLLVELAQGEYAQACGALLNEVNNGTIRYVRDAALDAAERGATTRALGDRWAWARSGSVDITPLEAATVALHGYRTQPSTEAWGFYE